MGFFDTVLRGLGGAVSGIGGGPLGMIGGGLAGILSGGGGAQESTSRMPQLRPYSDDERATLDMAYGNREQYMQRLSPDEQEALIGELAGTYYEPMAKGIQTQYHRAMGGQRVANARGGMLGSSKSQADNRQLSLDSADANARAYAQARLMGEQSFFNREQNRRGNLASNRSAISMIEGNRAAGSGMMSTHTYPDTFANDMSWGFGRNSGEQSDWYNGANDWISGLFKKDKAKDPMAWEQNKNSSGPIAWR